MLQETRDKGRKIKTDRGELDICRTCFTSEETEARSGKGPYRVMHIVGGGLISFSALGTYCVGWTEEEGVKQRAGDTKRKIHTEKNRNTDTERERVRKDTERGMRQVNGASEGDSYTDS